MGVALRLQGIVCAGCYTTRYTTRLRKGSPTRWDNLISIDIPSFLLDVNSHYVVYYIYNIYHYVLKKRVGFYKPP